MSESIHHCLKSFSKKIKALNPKKLDRFCSNILRKALVTNTREMKSPEKDNIAQLMVHSHKTADSYYNIEDRLKKTSNAHKAISEIMYYFDKALKPDEEKPRQIMPIPSSRKLVKEKPTKKVLPYELRADFFRNKLILSDNIV